MLLAGNLFSGTGYFFFSGVANFGDWAAVIAGLEPYWMWRLGLVVLGVVTYYASMLVVAAQLRPFHTKEANPRRIRGLAWTPYFTEGILAGLAGAVESHRFFLCPGLGNVVDAGRERGHAVSARHAARSVRARRGWRRAHRAKHGMDRGGRNRDPRIHLRDWPGLDLDALIRLLGVPAF